MLVQERQARRPLLSAAQLADLLNFVTGDPYPELTRVNPARRMRFFRFHLSLTRCWIPKVRRVIENWCDGVLERERIIPERERSGGRPPGATVPRPIAKILANVGSGAW